jgi:hypothetical protein
LCCRVVDAFDPAFALYHRLTNTHAKWCCTNFEATKECGCCCQGRRHII